jgi:hypothetical protein
MADPMLAQSAIDTHLGFEGRFAEQLAVVRGVAGGPGARRGGPKGH